MNSFGMLELAKQLDLVVAAVCFSFARRRVARGFLASDGSVIGVATMNRLLAMRSVDDKSQREPSVRVEIEFVSGPN